MKTTRPVLVGVLFLIAATGWAQQAGDTSSRELTIEELYLQNAEIRLIREQAISPERDMKLLALKNIEEMLEAGELSSGAPEAHLILDYLAGEGVERMVRENHRLINYYPEVRRRSAELLGELGGEESQSSLVRLLLTDTEPMVLAEAAYSLGRIGLNDDNETSQALAATVLEQDIINHDNNFAYASLLAFEKIAESNGGLTDASAIEAIIRISQGNYIRMVRNKAVEVLDMLKDL